MDGEDYKFAAYAPSAAASASWDYSTGLTLTVTGAGSNDLVYDDASVEGVTASSQGAVSLTFGHLLSKVAFKFTLDNTLAGLDVTMQNFKVGETIEMNGQWVAGTQGTAAASSKGSYTDFSTAQTIDATNGLTTTAWYVIPQTLGTITINASVKATDGVSTIKDGTITATLPITTIDEWEGGNYYLYTAELSIDNITTDPDTEVYPIEFEVEKVTGYGDPTEEEITFD